jgi:hypothetical protein
MGFMWSSPENPLKESLLNSNPETLLRTGDLLLAHASELEVTLNSELWTHIAIVVFKNGAMMAFEGGIFIPVVQWLNRHDCVITRHCNCIRLVGFDKRVLEAAEKTAEMTLSTDHFREGFSAGTMLEILGLASLQGVDELRPCHFSAGRSQLRNFSEHFII